MADVYDVTLTAEVRQMLASIRVYVSIGLEGTSTLLTCVGLSGFVAQLRFWMLVPPVLVGLIFVGSLATLLWKRDRSVSTAVVEVALPLTVRLLFVLVRRWLSILDIWVALWLSAVSWLAYY
jgi:hypothetical protein